MDVLPVPLKTRRFLACSALALFLAIFGRSGVEAQLKGTVVHSEFLQPLSQQDEIGQVFEGTALYKRMLAYRNAPVRKFLVPEWLAGTWLRSESTETSRIELSSGRHLTPSGTTIARVTDRFGTYRDRLGLIWQIFEPGEALGKIDRGASIDYHVVSGYDLMTMGQFTAIVEVRACHAVVDKKSGKMISAYQDEELNTYSMLAANLLKTDSSVKTFDVKGKPIYMTRAVSDESRLAPFVETAAGDAFAKAAQSGSPWHERP
jgi:hypothetical protein